MLQKHWKTLLIIEILLAVILGGVILLSPVHKKMPDKVFYGKFQNGEQIEDVEVSFLGTFQKENYLSKKNMQYVGTITIQSTDNPENDFCFFQKQCDMQEVEDGYEVLVKENGKEYKIMIMEKGEIYVRSK